MAFAVSEVEAFPKMEVPTLPIRKTSTCPTLPSATPDLTVFACLDDHGLTVTGLALIATDGDARSVARPTVTRSVAAVARRRPRAGRRCVGLAHVPFGHRPTTTPRPRAPVSMRFLRARLAGGHDRGAAPVRGKLTHGGLRWALEALVCQHLPVARIAESLDVSWHAANDAILAEGHQVLIDDPARFDGVTTIGVDEHVWRHTRLGDKYVTVIIDLTPVREKTGPARLLDMVPGRSKHAFKTWLAGAGRRPGGTGIDVVAMDGFTGYKTAAGEEIPDATAVMDPFHVVQLFGDALDKTRQRVQQDTLGHRGRKGDPLYGCRRLLRTGLGLLKQHQLAKLETVFDAHPDHVAVEVTWDIYQRAVAAYRHNKPATGRKIFERVIARTRRGVPTGPARAGHASAGRSSGARPTSSRSSTIPAPATGRPEAINGRLEHLRGTALGFRNITHYIARSLLEAGGFRPRLHAHLR